MRTFNFNPPLFRILAVAAAVLSASFLVFAYATYMDDRSIQRPFTWLLVSFSVLFALSSTGLFLKRNWGRLLLSFLCCCAVIGIGVLAVLLIEDNINDNFPGVLGGLSIFLLLIMMFVVFIVLLHSKQIKQELSIGARTATGPAGTPLNEHEAACAECGNVLSQADMVCFDGKWVCGDCKPRFVQKLKEGVEDGPGR